MPSFETSEIAGVEAQSLFLSPQVDLTYATFADRLVIATDRLAVEQARAGDGGLAGTDGFKGLTENLPDEVSLLVYLNLDGLLGLGEQVGLAEDPVYATFAPGSAEPEGRRPQRGRWRGLHRHRSADRDRSPPGRRGGNLADHR